MRVGYLGLAQRWEFPDLHRAVPATVDDPFPVRGDSGRVA